jgi:hypothetical protein
MKIQCTVDIKDDDIIGVLDSGLAYCWWWESVKLVAKGTNTEDAWAGHIMSGGAVAVIMDDKHGDTGALVTESIDQYVYRLDRETVEKGLQLLANTEKYVHHFSNILQDNADAETGDVLIQFALFGDAIYG